jgi:hypothetical protein
MTALLTTLLEVYPGWPAAEQGSTLDWMMLLFVGPLVLGGLIAVLGSARHWLGKA